MRLIARYAKECDDYFEVITLFDREKSVDKLDKKSPSMESLTAQYPSAIWFERKIADDFGISFFNSFDTRPLVHQEYFPLKIYPMRKEFRKKELTFSKYRPYQYEAIEGDGVFQVAVGPIHAGIIEPGHFHFSQEGEKMLHQEVRHFYKYRGIEKMVEEISLKEARPIIEKISGNETIAYQIAFIDICFQSIQKEYPSKLKYYHYFLLELERLIHHFTDLGFIPNDAGFSTALAYCSTISENLRRLMKHLTNHRFGFGAITTTVVTINNDYVKEMLLKVEKDIEWFEDWIMDIPSLWDRFDTTGILTKEDAKSYGTVGVMARASGLEIDCRIKNKIYQESGFKSLSQKSGDVGARFLQRIEEVKSSLTMMHAFLKKIEKYEEKIEDETSIDGDYHTFIESSIGELFMSIDIKENKIERFFVRDASHVNWQVLHTMMLRDIIADFPLINKSCDLSYAGNDL